MPYIYIADGFSRSDQSEGSFNLTGTVCNMKMYTATADVDALVPPKVAATRHLWVSSKTLEFSDKAPAPAGYFGNAVDAALPQPPAPVRYNVMNIREKEAVDHKEYRAKMVAGEIIARPLGVCTASAVAYPGLTTPLSNPVNVVFKRDQNGAFPVKTSIPCNIKGIAFPGNEGRVSGQPTSATLSNIRHKTKRYLVTSVEWKTPSRGVCEAMALEVYSALEAHEIDAGLVTSAIAAANNTGMDVLTAIGELPEMVKWVHHILMQMIHLSRSTRSDAIRVLRTTTGADIANAVASLWMQYRYAMMPLVYQYRDALKALSQDRAFLYITTRKVDQWDLELDIPGWTCSVLPVTDRVWLKRKYDTSLELTFPFQILVANLPQTMWELTKLSFVVDWALNVGDFLASLQPPIGVAQQVTCYSTAVPRNTRIDITSNAYPGMKVELNFGYYRTRTINPLAHIGLSADLQINWKRSLDAASLLWGAFRSRKG